MRQIEDLYLRHGQELAAYAFRMTGDADAARDVVQEAFAALVARGDIVGLSRPRAWLYAVVRRQSLKTRRGRKAVCLAQDLVAPEQPQAEHEIEAMHRAILQLPAEMQEVLELRLRAELSYQEIADAIDVPVGTVRSRLHNAVQRLRAQLIVAQEKQS